MRKATFFVVLAAVACYLAAAAAMTRAVDVAADENGVRVQAGDVDVGVDPNRTPSERAGDRAARAAERAERRADRAADRGTLNPDGAPMMKGPAALAAADTMTSGNVIRASKLIGMSVHNADDKSIGEINDVVLDAKTGHVRYLALSFGGFLGMGNKLFAIPWRSFETRAVKNGELGGNEYTLVLNIAPAQLRHAPGFDQNHWPDFSNREIANEIESYYQERTATKPAAPPTETPR